MGYTFCTLRLPQTITSYKSGVVDTDIGTPFPANFYQLAGNLGVFHIWTIMLTDLCSAAIVSPVKLGLLESREQRFVKSI